MTHFESCLLGKILGEAVDFKTVIAKSKSDWKIYINREVTYVTLGNEWIYFRLTTQLIKIFFGMNDRGISKETC